MNAANAPQATPAAAPPVRQKRMTLESISGGVIQTPRRLLVHGVDGVGKTTFGANAPAPVFVGTEDGSDHLDIKRFPAPGSWLDVLDAVQTLTTGKHPYLTLVIDSLDWAEPLLWRHMCGKNGVSNIEEIGGGFGKGYQAALDEWRVLLVALERLQRDAKMHVILLAHSFIKSFKNPLGDDFDRYVLKLHDKAAGLIREWCKGVYFANYETFAVKDKAKRVRGVSTGARILYTQRTAAYDAKDRYGLPEQIPLSWDDFESAAAAGRPAEPAALRAEITRKAKELGGELEKVVLETLAKAGEDPSKLAVINNRVNAKLAEKEN